MKGGIKVLDLKAIKNNKYFDEVFEIYNSLEDYELSYQIQNKRYKYANSDDSWFLYLNNLNECDYKDFIFDNKFLKIINNEVFDSILHQIDERLLLTLNEIIFIVNNADSKYVLDTYNVDLDSEHIGFYDGFRNAAIINLMAIIRHALNKSSSFEEFYNLVTDISLTGMIQELACFSLSLNELPKSYRVAGISEESLELYANKTVRTLKENMNINFLRRDFLSTIYKRNLEKKENL